MPSQYLHCLPGHFLSNCSPVLLSVHFVLRSQNGHGPIHEFAMGCAVVGKRSSLRLASLREPSSTANGSDIFVPVVAISADVWIRGGQGLFRGR